MLRPREQGRARPIDVRRPHAQAPLRCPAKAGLPGDALQLADFRLKKEHSYEASIAIVRRITLVSGDLKMCWSWILGSS
jgi:hypothetical protein